MSTPVSGRVPASLLLAVACLSGSILIVELTLTRVFSVTMFHHFAFLAISIAMFGLSASSVFIYVTPRLHPAADVRKQLQRYSAVFWIVATLSAVLLLKIRVGLEYSTANAARMIGIYLVASAPFVTGGAVLALAVSRLHADIGRVYAADLLGAAAGCLLLVPLLNAIGGPGMLLFAAALGALASLLFAASDGRVHRITSWVPLAGAGVLLGIQLWHPWLDVRGAKGHGADNQIFSKWNSFSRIAVYNSPHHDWGLSETYAGPRPASLYMDIDSAASTSILKGPTSGDDSLRYLEYELTALAYRLKPNAHVLVIGPGGGRDLWSALVHGATRVEGVEVNPIIARDVMQGAFRAYSGDVYNAPGVTVAVDDGRSYVSRSKERYDVIQASLVDTWAATTAGAFALTENNLYTVEAFDAYFRHLAPDGILTVNRWYQDGLRLVSLALAAGAGLGWRGLADRVFIGGNGQLATFIFKNSPLRDDEIAMLVNRCRELKFRVVYAPTSPSNPIPAPENEYARLVTTPAADLPDYVRAFPKDVSPTTDDRPFFFQPDKPGSPFRGRFDRSMLFGSGTEVLSGLLVISVVLLALFVFVPLAVLSPEPIVWRDLPIAPLAYFACLGAGFMFVEIGLMQRFVLLLGHPVYSLTVTLFSLLVGTGLGSMVSRRASDAHLRRTAAVSCLAVAAIALVWGNALPAIVRAAVGWPLALRIALAAGLMVPAGLVMGIPLPTGIRILAGVQPQLVPWAWGMNGALSVLGATLAVFVAMNWGFSLTLACGAVTYACAAALIWRR